MLWQWQGKGREAGKGQKGNHRKAVGDVVSFSGVQQLHRGSCWGLGCMRSVCLGSLHTSPAGVHFTE